MKKIQKLSIYLHPAEADEIEKVARMVNISLSEFLRLAVRQYMIELRIKEIRAFLKHSDDEKRRDAIKALAELSDALLLEVVE
jgi:hypothetical protein